MPELWTSRFADLGARTHYVEFQPDDAGGAGPETPTIVLVHGIGGSHLNWMRLGPMLARRHRVLALDLPGHGLSHPLPPGYSIDACQTIVDRFIDAVGGPPVVLVGHSMGGLISLTQASRQPEKLSRLVLMSPASPVPARELARLRTLGFIATWAAPGVIGRYMAKRSRRINDELIVRSTLAFVYARGRRPDEDIVAAHLELQRRRRRELAWVDTALPETARSLVQTLLLRRRYQAMAAGLTVPTLLLQGTVDRVVPFEASLALSRLRPDWPFVALPGTGHMVQLEAAERCLDEVESWLSRPSAAER